MKALVIEDDPDIQEAVSLSFEFRWPEITVTIAPDGRSGVAALELESPDIVILDLGLPDMDGFQVCEELRKRSAVPILVLTVRNREADIIKALNIGADDYMTKPFSEIHLLARVQALLRRSKPEDTEPVFLDGELRVDFERREVRVGDQLVKLTPTEYKLLTLLVKNADKVMSHQELLEKVWGPEYLEATDYLKSHIHHLRQKLGDNATVPAMILNERAIGYRFVTTGQAARRNGSSA